MALLGNVLIILCILITAGLYSVVFGRKPGGDAMVGYAWSLIILSLLFVIGMILTSMVIGAKGGYDWISAHKSSRFWIVTIGILSAVITTALAALFKGEGGPVPGFFRATSHILVVAIPVLMLFSFIILNNPSLRDQLPVVIYKWPLMISFIIGVTGVTAAVGSWFIRSAKNQTAAIEHARKADQDNIQRMLKEIDSNDVSKNKVFLLVFTDANQDQQVREKALEKIFAYPEWKSEMVRFLESDWAPEAFTFFASNNVEQPEFFIEPIRTGILNQARLIRETIRRCKHPSHLYEGRFTWEVERVLRTADKFAVYGANYTAEVKALRAALDEPWDWDKPNFACKETLDRWIKKHS